MFPSPADGFDKRGTGSMRAVERICETAGMDSDVMTRRVANSPPERRGDRRQVGFGWKRPRLLDEPLLIAGEPRVAVHAAEFERHPIGTQIALFEHIGPHSAQGRHS